MRSRRRRRLVRTVGIVLVVAAAGILVALRATPASSDAFATPSRASLVGLTVRQRIAAIADSQIGYRTAPASTYCNKFSAFWNAGMSGCPGAERAEEWCADFAAWTWRVAGLHLAYGYGPDELNGAAASFYEWGVANGRWHPAGEGYLAQPGDVAVYGLSLAGPSPVAAHVAVVVSEPPQQRGPNVVNGDGDRTGHSVVAAGADQLVADDGHHRAALSGYVSPP